MKKLTERLREYGADVDGAMGRFLGDEELYEACFAAFLKDEAFLKLGEALEQSDEGKAFEYAHMLKGVTGNMGLTPLYWVICELVEELRSNRTAALTDTYAQLVEQLRILGEIRE